MICHECQQGSADWWKLRLGVPTASAFDKIITSKGKLSAQSKKYSHKLAAEWLLGIPIDDYQSEWMERGHDLEPEAWAYYEMRHDVDVERGGFCTTDDGLLGASPDGRIYEGDTLVGGIELKCPKAETHVGYMLEPDTLAQAYRHQVQGCLLVTGAQWWDLMSYHPMLPPVVVRVTPETDVVYVEALRQAALQFAADVEALKQSLSEHKRAA